MEEQIRITYWASALYPGDDEQIRHRLRRLEERRIAAVTVVEMSGRKQEELVYAELARPGNARRIALKTGKRPEEHFVGPGPGHGPRVKGTIAIYSDEGIEYVAKNHAAVELISEIQKRPKATIGRILDASATSIDEEQVMSLEFQERGCLTGRFIPAQESPAKVRLRLPPELSPGTVPTREVDLVCLDNDGSVWVIEIEVQLNYEAIGQALAYHSLYQATYPGLTVRRAIVCRTSCEDLEYACKCNDIQVFVLGERTRTLKH